MEAYKKILRCISLLAATSKLRISHHIWRVGTGNWIHRVWWWFICKYLMNHKKEEFWQWKICQPSIWEERKNWKRERGREEREEGNNHVYFVTLYALTVLNKRREGRKIMYFITLYALTILNELIFYSNPLPLYLWNVNLIY